MIKVYLIECVDSESEHPIGIETAKWVIRPRAETENVALSVAEPINAYGLSKLLNDAYHEMKEYPVPGPPVVLHLDAHGNERGIVMRSGELVSWKDIAGYCEQLSTLNNIKTIIIMGACKGAYALEMLEFCKRAPFFCLFGPQTDINSKDLQPFYRDFYTLLMNHKNITTVAREVMSIHKDQIYFATSFQIFELAYVKYFSPEMDQVHAQRRKKIAERIMRLPIPIEEKQRRLCILKNPSTLVSSIFDQFRRDFLLLDLFPNNVERFEALTFESIVKKARDGSSEIPAENEIA